MGGAPAARWADLLRDGAAAIALAPSLELGTLELAGVALTDIYLVECGEYSGRYVAGAFRTAEEADAAARAWDGYVTEVDFGELGDKEKRFLRPGERQYHVSMDSDGNNAEASATWSAAEDLLSVRIRDEKPQRFSCTCWAPSEQGAIKILNERRSAWLAGPRAFNKRNVQSSYSGGIDHGWREAILK